MILQIVASREGFQLLGVTEAGYTPSAAKLACQAGSLTPVAWQVLSIAHVMKRLPGSESEYYACIRWSLALC